MKQWPFAMLVFCTAVSLAACAAAPATATITASSAPSLVVTATSAPTKTATPLPPTAPPIPTVTDTPQPPTLTPTPTEAPTATIEPSATIDLCRSAGGSESRRVRLTIVNKTGFDLSLKMTGCYDRSLYQLTVPVGTAGEPTEKVFTLMTGTYDTVVLLCQEKENRSLFNINNPLRLTFTGCDEAAATATP